MNSTLCYKSLEIPQKFELLFALFKMLYHSFRGECGWRCGRKKEANISSLSKFIKLFRKWCQKFLSVNLSTSHENIVSSNPTRSTCDENRKKEFISTKFSLTTARNKFELLIVFFIRMESCLISANRMLSENFFGQTNRTIMFVRVTFMCMLLEVKQ